MWENDPKLAQLRKKSMQLPLTPGVYIMKDKTGKIIYIGKAKALKNRVSQYFGSQNNHPVKVRKMVQNVDSFDYILTDSEFEALVLECSLIKQNMPKYNILLKDSKGYSYVKITAGPWGNIFSCYRKDDENASYLGPYTGYSVSNAVDEAKEIFRLPTCAKVFPRDIGKSRPCLNYFIGKCSAPGAKKISQKQYEQDLKDAVEFIKGGSKKALAGLEKKMLEAAEKNEFEKAAQYRDKIRAINKIAGKQKVVLDSDADIDVFAVTQSYEKACLAVINFRDGKIVGSEHYIIAPSEDSAELRRELVTSYYISERDIPKKIIVDEEPAEKELIEEYLASKRGKKVEISVPKRGEYLQISEMCKKNAAQNLGLYLGRKGTETAALDELASLLGLEKPPEYIESYDISHTAGADNVAGMVMFRGGKSYKPGYRHFAIKGFSGQDDYGSMREVMERRLKEYSEKQGTNDAFAIKPDLILLDGGEGQVNAVLPVIREYGLDIPVFGMVKDSKHRTRAITGDGEEIVINDKRKVFTLISTIQEEVHRFAISYHKKKHTASTVRTKLTSIDGIGEKKAQLLLRHFKSFSKISLATREELAAVAGISGANADAVFSYFHAEEDDVSPEKE